jgi:hypothetical protein
MKQRNVPVSEEKGAFLSRRDYEEFMSRGLLEFDEDVTAGDDETRPLDDVSVRLYIRELRKIPIKGPFTVPTRKELAHMWRMSQKEIRQEMSTYNRDHPQNGLFHLEPFVHYLAVFGPGIRMGDGLRAQAASRSSFARYFSWQELASRQPMQEQGFCSEQTEELVGLVRSPIELYFAEGERTAQVVMKVGTPRRLEVVHPHFSSLIRMHDGRSPLYTKKARKAAGLQDDQYDAAMRKVDLPMDGYPLHQCHNLRSFLAGTAETPKFPPDRIGYLNCGFDGGTCPRSWITPNPFEVYKGPVTDYVTMHAAAPFLFPAEPPRSITLECLVQRVPCVLRAGDKLLEITYYPLRTPLDGPAKSMYVQQKDTALSAR